MPAFFFVYSLFLFRFTLPLVETSGAMGVGL